MCGIACILNASDVPSFVHMNRMLDAISHRGPDAQKQWYDDTIHLGHCRLSILDTGERADQPMVSYNGKYVIVYNGEIYNFREIRHRLEQCGYTFKTTGDTEVLLIAFIHWGESCLQYLDGMFAFAIWNTESKRLFIARDRFGEKPLYFSRLKYGGFILGSEIKSLLYSGLCPLEINQQALRQYLEIGYVLSPLSIIQGVHKLEAAHYLWVNNDGTISDQYCYWDLAESFQHKRNYSSMNNAIDDLFELLNNSVEHRMISDVPLGMFLSGGIDSALIASSACQFVKNNEVKTFSTGFNEIGYSELPEARESAQALGTMHFDHLVSTDSLLHDIEHIIRSADEPFADTSIIPTYYLAKFTREHVTVSLSGDAGDELFAGYETYAADQYYRMVSWLPSPCFQFADKMIGLIPATKSKVGKYYKARAFFRGTAYGNDNRAHWAWRQLFYPSAIKELMINGDDFVSSTNDSFMDAAYYYEKMSYSNWLDRMQYVDIKTWLQDDILVKIDRMSMAHSLEGRVPFLDHKIAEFAASLPMDYRRTLTAGKRILRQSLKTKLPPSISKRTKKGFNAPVSHWVVTKLKNHFWDLLNTEPFKSIIRPESIHSLLTSHEKCEDDHGYKLFALYCLALWFNTVYHDAQIVRQ